MATIITYKGNQLSSFSSGTKTLKTAGKYMEDDVTLQTGNTATIEALSAYRNYLTYKGSRYYSNSTFTFSAGDTLSIEVYGEMAGAFIYEDDIQIGTCDSNSPYTYILPNHDITITTENSGAGARCYITSTIDPLTIPLQDIILRPDATVFQTYTYDQLIKADNQLDEGVTFPTYSTTLVTLRGVKDLTPTLTLDQTNYNYYIIERFLTIPIYNITSKAKGRFEYATGCAMYEFVDIKSNDFKALLDGTTYNNTYAHTLVATGSAYRDLYWNGNSTLEIYSGSSYGTNQSLASPTFSNGVLTLRSPSCSIRGSTTYLTSTYYNAITDIRYQYIIQVYRAPKNTLNRDGWSISQGIMNIVDCVNNNNQTLT